MSKSSVSFVFTLPQNSAWEDKMVSNLWYRRTIIRPPNALNNGKIFTFSIFTGRIRSKNSGKEDIFGMYLFRNQIMDQLDVILENSSEKNTV